ncbi:MAG: hypothetical protein BJBARM5_0753 [Candidatus Parvarchaeum acidophilus ARMAN-5]|jgi:cell division protein FtsL|uniref:Uncharacterized protein n=1 Tax=Candidatus Parvarchaeum acidophilus ARMAN-5 TaxID=662762 RepID=D6GW79_PARA5|nr:MAG: hypothetical protein BJBARM5_0753 [Candidatus Parvarchaeum acidophilus ARMAN-5]
MNKKAQMITIFFSLFLILAIITILGIEYTNLQTNQNLNSLEQAYNLPKLEYYNFLGILSKTSNINPSNNTIIILNSTVQNIYDNFFQNLNATLLELNTNNLIMRSVMTLYINGKENSNTSIGYGTQSNFTAVILPNTDYVSLYLNGTKIVPLTQGKATYLNTLQPGLYKVTAYSNASGLKNITYYEKVLITTFIESNLPSGTKWNVTYDGITNTSTSDKITFSVPPGTYSFSVPDVFASCIHTPSPSSGTLTAYSSQSITFSVCPHT